MPCPGGPHALTSRAVGDMRPKKSYSRWFRGNTSYFKYRIPVSTIIIPARLRYQSAKGKLCLCNTCWGAHMPKKKKRLEMRPDAADVMVFYPTGVSTSQ